MKKDDELWVSPEDEEKCFFFALKCLFGLILVVAMIGLTLEVI